MDDWSPPTKPGTRGDLYERDFYAWGLRQAALIRAGRLGDVDLDNVAEEIEGLSRSDKRELVSRLTVLLLHLLKLQYQSELEGRSWRITVREQRRVLLRLIADSPSLKAFLAEAVETAYADGREDAADETGLSCATFPGQCPWSADQIMDGTFWPSAV